MYEFLTLAITETTVNTGKFNVIAMEMKSKEIISFGLNREQIISSQGEVFWDIGFTTITDEKPRRKYINNGQPNENSQFILTGTIKLGNSKYNILKNILDAKANTSKDFFENNKLRFCVLKVDRLEDIQSIYDEKNNRLKNYLTIRAYGVPMHINPLKFTNKDYRWINYWDFIYENSNFIEKKHKYINLFNSKNKTLYLIIYRHKFKDKDTNWIVGMHWL